MLFFGVGVEACRGKRIALSSVISPQNGFAIGSAICEARQTNVKRAFRQSLIILVCGATEKNTPRIHSHK